MYMNPRYFVRAEGNFNPEVTRIAHARNCNIRRSSQWE